MQSVVGASLNRIPAIDGLRGIAILSVLLWHFFSPSRLPFEFRPFITLGWSGVDLFFVLSGYLLGSILLTHRESVTYFKAFYVRRAARILPAYYLLLLAWIVLRAVIGTDTPHLQHTLEPNLPSWSYPLFIQNFFMVGIDSAGARFAEVTWSLCIEEQFYLVLPLLIRYVPIRILPLLSLSFVLAAPFVRGYLKSEYNVTAAFVLLPARMDALVVGVLIAYLAVKREDLILKFRYIVVALFVALFGYLIFLVWKQYPALVVPFTYRDIFFPLALFYGAFLLLVLSFKDGILVEALSLRPISALGRWCYGIYLAHMPLLMFSKLHLDTREPLVAAILCLVAIGIGAASWRWVEKPFILWSRRFRY